MNPRTMYIDNCKLKKTRNRFMGYSVKINEIDKKKNLYLQLIFYYEYFYQGFAIY
jgi:hypothetical protein